MAERIRCMQWGECSNYVDHEGDLCSYHLGPPAATEPEATDILERLRHFERNQMQTGDDYGAEVLHRAQCEIEMLRLRIAPADPSEGEPVPKMREEYDFSNAVRGKYTPVGEGAREALEALRPFADYARLEDSTSGHTAPDNGEVLRSNTRPVYKTITTGDFRRAREVYDRVAALASQPAATECSCGSGMAQTVIGCPKCFQVTYHQTVDNGC